MELEEDNYETGSGSWMLSFILGGLIGAAVALLVAPKSGRQTREQIKDIAEDAKDIAEDYYDQARSKISTAMEKGAEVLRHKKAEMESMVGKKKQSNGGPEEAVY